MPGDLTLPGEGAARAIDRAYLDAAPADHRRLHAQVFTPPALAAVMADWVCAKAPRTVLDPALGTGVLARAVARRLPEAEITAFEIDPRPSRPVRHPHRRQPVQPPIGWSRRSPPSGASGACPEMRRTSALASSWNTSFS